MDMHEIVFYLATGWLLGLLAVNTAFIVAARSAMVRVLALDTFTMVLIAVLVVFAYAHRSPYYLDAALVLALLAFVGTLAAARYHGEGKVFT
jgi:multicomponent Na+:H+ antiporter subunit F